MTNRWLKECDCGFGPGRYHDHHQGKHEFNPYVSADIATMPYQVDRDPVGELYHHFSGTHYIQTNKQFSPYWEFNGNVDKPTVSPSILVRSGRNGRNGVCHSFIKNGRIQFLGDCTHELAGQTVEIPEWD